MQTGGHQPCGRTLNLLDRALKLQAYPTEIDVDVRLLDCNLDVELSAKSPNPGLANAILTGGDIKIDLSHALA